MTPRTPHDALWNWFCEFDAEAVIASFTRVGLEPRAGVLTNFLGTRIEPAVHPAVLEGLAGLVEGPPAPGNWHADIAEWAAALRSVALAEASGRGRYRIVELGCGWGCWITNMGVAARSRGLQVDLVGVEADAGHLAQARRTLSLNGFGEGEFRLHHGVAGPRRGQAIFPAAGLAGWNGEAVFDPTPEQIDEARGRADVELLDCLTLADLLGGAAIDLLHIDIQGAEAEFVAGNREGIAAHVRRVLIGTHSREIEGRLFALFGALDWRLEMERPAIAPPVNGRSRILIDGVQLWANPNLA